MTHFDCASQACGAFLARTLRPLLTAVLASMLASALTGCVSYAPAQQIPEITLSGEQVRLASAGPETGSIDFGMDVSVNESDSLFNLETLPGVRVRSVVAGGAASAAGIRAGDIVLNIDGLATDAPDAIRLLEQNGEAGAYDFTVRRDTTVFAASVSVREARRAAEPQELYRIDPLATRAAYRSVLLSVEDGEAAGERPLAAARVVEFLDQSPLRRAGIDVGDSVLALEGRQISSAQDLITRLSLEHELGDRVSLDVFDGVDVARVEVALWHPGRTISRVSLGPLASYEASPRAASKEFTLLNLWFFSLYHYRQVQGERVHKVLGLFEFASDYGELVEEAQP